MAPANRRCSKSSPVCNVLHPAVCRFSPNDVTIGYLPQQMVLEDDATVVEEVRKVFAHIEEMKQRLDHLSNELSNRTDYESDDYQQLIERVSDLTEQLAMASSDNCEAELEKTLMGLGFVRSDFERPTLWSSAEVGVCA